MELEVMLNKLAWLEKLTDAEVAYAAGLFDGEGCVGIYFPSKSCYAIRVQFQMTTREGIDFIQSKFGGVVSNRQRLPPRQSTFEIVYHGQEAIFFLEAIERYLVVKRDEVCFVLQTYEKLQGEPLNQEAIRCDYLEQVGKLYPFKHGRPKGLKDKRPRVRRCFKLKNHVMF